MGCNDCKDKKKCENKYVIKCLPCTIYRPGYYCLGKDFELYSGSQPAITIISDNVVLDFKSRIITTNAALDRPLIKIEGATDVKLNNVHLEATGSAVDANSGISVINSNNVKIKNATLLDIGGNDNPEDGQLPKYIGLFTNNVNGLIVEGLFSKNSIAIDHNVFIYNSVKIEYRNSNITNARSRITVSENILVENLTVDNSQTRVECLQFDSAADGSFNPPKRICQNIVVKNSNFYSNDANPFRFIGFFDGYEGFTVDAPVRNLVVENNVIRTRRSFGFALLIQASDGYIVRGNEIMVEGDLCFGILSALSSRGLIENNNVTTKDLETVSYGGIFIITDAPSVGTSKYTTISSNSVSGFQFGYSDNVNGLIPNSYAFCTVFKNNVGFGNNTNFDYTVGAPAFSVYDSNNIDSCPLESLNVISISNKVWEK